MTGLLLSKLRAWVALTLDVPECEQERQATLDLLHDIESPDTVPTIDIAGKSPGDLLEMFITNAIPRHCFLQIGHARHRVRPETRASVQRGILLAVELSVE